MWFGHAFDIITRTGSAIHSGPRNPDSTSEGPATAASPSAGADNTSELIDGEHSRATHYTILTTVDARQPIRARIS